MESIAIRTFSSKEQSSSLRSMDFYVNRAEIARRVARNSSSSSIGVIQLNIKYFTRLLESAGRTYEANLRVY